jgi:hypothetical protein
MGSVHAGDAQSKAHTPTGPLPLAGEGADIEAWLATR